MPHTLETLKVTGKVTYEPNDFIESDCWIWNGATTGTKVDYGHVWDSRESRVHRLVFLLTYGHRPTPQAAHRCGHSLCFNPDHIYEATKEQNEADKRQHGTDNWGIREREKTRCPQDHHTTTAVWICRALISAAKRPRPTRVP